jgi:hypothetical protein
MLWKPQYSRCMSTALLYCGMPEGFIIGTDSRAFNKLTRQVETDNERKIFAFENSSASVVFAWSGIVKVRTPDFDFSLIQTSNDILPKVNFKSFEDDFNTRLRESLSVLKVNTTGKCAHGIFLYFWKGAPIVFELYAFKNGSTWDSCVSDGGTPNGEIDIISGPGELFKRPNSLDQAKNMIESYIRGSIADPERPDIGGDPHIGKLSSDGFEWILPPK